MCGAGRIYRTGRGWEPGDGGDAFADGGEDHGQGAPSCLCLRVSGHAIRFESILFKRPEAGLFARHANNVETSQFVEENHAPHVRKFHELQIFHENGAGTRSGTSVKPSVRDDLAI